MQEGWQGDDYLILFNEPEIAQVSAGYGIADFLPGHVIVGLRGWDDFIVRDERGNTLSVPTVPLDARYFSPFSLPKELQLKVDPRFSGKSSGMCNLLCSAVILILETTLFGSARNNTHNLSAGGTHYIDQ